MPRKPDAELTIWRPSGLPAVEAMLGRNCRHPYPRHWHEEFLLSVITAGTGTFHHQGSVHRVAEGSAFFVAPGEVHANYAGEEGCSFRSVYLPVGLVQEAAAELSPLRGWEENLPSGLVDDQEVYRSYLQLHCILQHPSTALHRDSAMLRFLMLLLRHQSKSRAPLLPAGRESKAIRRAQEFLREHYARCVTLEELANLTELPKFRLHRAFCRQVGIPPHQYQLQVRVARVKAMLRARWPIAVAAAAAGFTDQSHLGRHFKRLTGVTPGEYPVVARTSNTTS